MNTQQIDPAMLQLAQAMSAVMGQTQKAAVGSSPNYTYGFSGGGLFAIPGLSNPMFSLLQLPITGLQAILPSYPSIDTNPLMPVLAGVSAPTGSQPNGVCDDPLTAGLASICVSTNPFGRYSLGSPVFDLDQFGKRVNAGVNQNLQIPNPPSLTGFMPSLPGISGGGVAGLVRAELQKLMIEFGAGWVYAYGKQTYKGSPLNNTAGGGYKEFQGLDTLINTGKHDAESGLLCKAADSVVSDFGSLNISGSANAANATAVVLRIIAIYRYLDVKARRSNMGQCTWALCMSEQLFYELTAIWPCVYNTSTCATSIVQGQGVQIVQNGADNVTMREQMRAGDYLLINGKQVRVILDDAITETTSDGLTFTSQVYFVPLTVLGRIPVTFYEYFDYEGTGGAIEAAKILAPDGFFMASDGGRFLWTKKAPNAFCVQFMAKTETRLKMLTPQIAARLINITYTPALAIDSPWPTDLTYKNTGGVVSQPTAWYNYTTP